MPQGGARAGHDSNYAPTDYHSSRQIQALLGRHAKGSQNLHSFLLHFQNLPLTIGGCVAVNDGTPVVPWKASPHCGVP